MCLKTDTERAIPMKIKIILQFILNPRFLLCFGIAWMITNGWSYVLLTIGTWLQISWMIALSGAYMALLWFPFTPEKLFTVIIAMALLRWLFPNDQKTLGILKNLYAKTKREFSAYREKRARKKANRRDSDR